MMVFVNCNNDENDNISDNDGGHVEGSRSKGCKVWTVTKLRSTMVTRALIEMMRKRNTKVMISYSNSQMCPIYACYWWWWWLRGVLNVPADACTHVAQPPTKAEISSGSNADLHQCNPIEKSTNTITVQGSAMQMCIKAIQWKSAQCKSTPWNKYV